MFISIETPERPNGPGVQVMKSTVFRKIIHAAELREGHAYGVWNVKKHEFAFW